ncbi:MAG: ROK family protein [Elusimicrobia bacterium]|nr:ROK family protein [Elusimicrobiota bacterium]
MTSKPALRNGAGIDVGGTFTKAAVVSAAGKVLREDRIATRPSEGPRTFVSRVAALLSSWRREGLSFSAAGLAIAGDVDAEKGVLRFSPNLPKFDGFRLRDELSARLEVPVVMDNDANLAVWGAYRTELYGRPQNVVGVTLGTGVGGGLVLAGRLYRGSTGSAGEIGHARVEIPGELCHCGRRGCLEAYAGSYGIVRRARRLLAQAPRAGRLVRALCPDLRNLEPAHLSEAAQKGDALARRLWAETGFYLAVGLSNLVLVFNPDAVLILGGVSRAGRWLLDPIKEYFKAQPFKTPFGRAKLKLADNPNAGRVGAALLALDQARPRR